MCGIVGIVGKENASEILIQGLEKLEYRGYDSAGIFVLEAPEKMHLVKSAGRINDLKEKITDEVKGKLGIGHTRWATHGKPSVTNAHPHNSASGRFILVHNGVIENYQDLKETYLADVPLKGETDTEIIVQLIAKFAEDDHLTAKEALRHTLAVIRGSYAFELIDVNEPDVIYVAKNKSPLLIGLGDGFTAVCSDAMAMLKETDEFVEILDGEVVEVRQDGIIIEDVHGKVVQRESYKAAIDLGDIEKGTYPYYMLKEIDEQPAVMRRVIEAYTDETQQIKIDEQIAASISEADRIYIIACGTSAHAGWAGKEILEVCTNIPVEVHLSSEFGYHMPLLSQHPFFIYLSQSGETADSRQVLVQTSEMGYPALTITNAAGSTLSREADFTMLLHAGPEIAVASTKAYTAQVAVLAILAKACGEKRGLEAARNFQLVRELGLTASVMDELIAQQTMYQEIVNDYLSFTPNAFYIGRGSDYYVAMEAALKLKEISYIQAEGFAAGELKHGTIALIEEGTPVFGLISHELMGSHTRGNLKETESRGAHVCTIALAKYATETDQIIVPDVHPLLTPLVMVIPAQFIAYYACLSRGYDVDKPRNLAKSVTVE